MPLVRRMDLSDVRYEELTEETEEKECQGDLLASDDDGMSSEVKGQCAKYWFPSRGGVDCFATLHEILKEIGLLTGTKLRMESQMKGVHIVGANSKDVDDAFERLKNIEKSFVSLWLFHPWASCHTFHLRLVILTYVSRLYYTHSLAI
jgi:hypothetical protein